MKGLSKNKSHKIIKDLMVGDVIIAIDECKMKDGVNCLIIGKEYVIKDFYNKNLFVLESEINSSHLFLFDDFHSFFKIKHKIEFKPKAIVRCFNQYWRVDHETKGDRVKLVNKESTLYTKLDNCELVDVLEILNK